MTNAMSGEVSPFREAILRLTLHGANGTQEVETLLDTGYDGSLTLSPALVTALGLTYRHQGRAVLADGSEASFRVCEAFVDWFGERRRITVDEMDATPLAGMSLLYGCDLHIQVIDGGMVAITQLESNEP